MEIGFRIRFWKDENGKDKIEIEIKHFEIK